MLYTNGSEPEKRAERSPVTPDCRGISTILADLDDCRSLAVERPPLHTYNIPQPSDFQQRTVDALE